MKFKKLQLHRNTVASAASAVVFAAVVFVILWGFGKWNPTEMDASTAFGAAQKIACCGGIALLLGSLIFVLARELLRTKTDFVCERPAWFYPLLSGILSLGAMCVAYTFIGMWPFGEKTGMMVDMHHQYAPLLAELRYDLLHGGNPFYTFELGLGANYLSMFGYYLASPLNLLLVLFPERLLAEGILFVTLIKNALCGAMFALCVQQLFKKKDLCIPIVSVMYSLMMYLLAYSWNIMWLDVVMFLPLVVYGLERLLRTGKYLTYTLSLAYCLFANYYIGFMLCIFLVLYFVAYCLYERRTGREIGLAFGRFAGFSLLGGGLVAALLIPVFLALKATSAAGADLPNLTNTLDIFQIIGRHLADTTPTIRSGNLPNVYCGVLTALCVPLFMVNKEIPMRRRFTFSALWLGMLFSMLVNWSDLAWHGFHAPNDLPYRFSFLYSFVLLLMAYEVLCHIRALLPRQIVLVFAGALVYLMLEEHFGDKAYTFEVVYINLALIAVYTVVLLLCANRLFRQRVAYAVLLLVVTAEMTFGAGNTLLTMNSNEYFTRHEDYVDNEKTEAIRLAVAKTQFLGDKAANGDFYRLEFLPRRTCVDTSLFHYRGITAFSSSNYYTTTKLMGGIGYAINGVNSHLYHSFVPFTDSLLGIRYVIMQANLTNHPQLKKLDTVTYGETTYHIYENTTALGVGYVVNDAVKDYTFTKYNPFASQEELFTALTGQYSELYTLATLEAFGDSVGAATYPSPGFSIQPSDGIESTSFKATVEKAGQVFIYADCSAADSMTVRSGENEWSVTPHEPYIIDGGYMSEGTEVHLSVTSDTPCVGKFYVATMDKQTFNDGIKTLSSDQLVIDSFNNNRLHGTVNTDKDGVLMTTIPYDKGWRVTVDGVKIDTFGVNDGFLAFDMIPGKHMVEMVYTPSGFWIGAAISVLSLLVLIALLIFPHIKWKKPLPQPVSQPEPEEIEPEEE